jgi:hypothetical protein
MTHPCRSAKPYNFFAVYAFAQPSLTACEVLRDMFAFVSEKAPEVRSLCSICRLRRVSPLHPNSHGRNITLPLDGCYSNHMIHSQ